MLVTEKYGEAMKKIITIIVAGLVLSGQVAFAGNGDLSVNGTINVGTAVAFPDGTRLTTATVAAVGGGIPNGIGAYSIPGTYSFVVPAGVTRLFIEAWGAGGGGSGTGITYYEPTNGCGGGGGGQYRGIVAVTPNQAYSVVVGAGGSGGVSGYNAPQFYIGGTGGNGGRSSFGGTVVANGGGGAAAGSEASCIPGIGGSGGGSDPIRGGDGHDLDGGSGASPSSLVSDGGAGADNFYKSGQNGGSGKVLIYW
jgi:hypothetical protein